MSENDKVINLADLANIPVKTVKIFDFELDVKEFTHEEFGFLQRIDEILDIKSIAKDISSNYGVAAEIENLNQKAQGYEKSKSVLEGALVQHEEAMQEIDPLSDELEVMSDKTQQYIAKIQDYNAKMEELSLEIIAKNTTVSEESTELFRKLDEKYKETYLMTCLYLYYKRNDDKSKDLLGKVEKELAKRLPDATPEDVSNAKELVDMGKQPWEAQQTALIKELNNKVKGI